MCNQNGNERFTANNGAGFLTNGNPNRDGSGPIVNLLTARSNGTQIQDVSIQATGPTTQGMIRLFILDPGSSQYYLLLEIDVDAVVPTPLVQAFKTVAFLDVTLAAGWILAASTENSEQFSVLANGVDWEYCECTA